LKLNIEKLCIQIKELSILFDMIGEKLALKMAKEKLRKI